MSILAGHAFPFKDLMPLLVSLGLSSFGVVLIVASSGIRTKMLSKRIDSIRGNSVVTKNKMARKRPEERVISQPISGVTESEHRHIIRIYSKFGVPPESAYAYFSATRLILVLALPVLMLPMLPALYAKFHSAAPLAMAAPAALGYLLPGIIVRNSVTRHKRAVARGLPDALELLAVCVEAGLSLENALQRVSAELKRSLPSLADELALTWAEINILPDRDQALLNFAERVDLPSVRAVVTTLSQTLRYGTPLARSLRVVAADVRAEQLTQMEEKANRLPALMTVPVMLLIMPTIFLIVGGPAALKVMDMFFAGH